MEYRGRITLIPSTDKIHSNTHRPTTIARANLLTEEKTLTIKTYTSARRSWNIPNENIATPHLKQTKLTILSQKPE